MQYGLPGFGSMTITEAKYIQGGFPNFRKNQDSIVIAVKVTLRHVPDHPMVVQPCHCVPIRSLHPKSFFFFFTFTQHLLWFIIWFNKYSLHFHDVVRFFPNSRLLWGHIYETRTHKHWLWYNCAGFVPICESETCYYNY